MDRTPLSSQAISRDLEVEQPEPKLVPILYLNQLSAWVGKISELSFTLSDDEFSTGP